MRMSYEEKIALIRKIMMAGIVSLLAATILIIFLHLYANYLLTRRERMMTRHRAASLHSFSSDASVHIDSSQLARRAGLDAVIISALPKFLYGARMHDREEAVDCSVCLSPVSGEDTVRMLPNCEHFFHSECIDEWLALHTTCPICRTPAEPRSELGLSPVEPGSASVAAESQTGSSSLLSSFRKLLIGRVHDGFNSNDVESQ